MKARTYTIAGSCILLLATALLIMKQSWKTAQTPVKTESSSNEESKGDSPGGIENEDKLLISGVGSMEYATKQLNFKTDDWMRAIQDKLKPELLPQFSDDRIELLNSEDAWSRTDAYFGDDEQILHVDLNKGEFITYPLDNVAILEMQERHGMAIVKLGYPDDLLESGFTKYDFLAATYEHWSEFGVGRECEITPVVVKVVPITRKGSFSEPNPYLKYMGQEFPMILLKTGRKYQHSEAAFITGTFTDRFSHEESVLRTWVLTPYVPVEENGKMVLPPIGANAILKEPLMEAWKKHQANPEKKER